MQQQVVSKRNLKATKPTLQFYTGKVAPQEGQALKTMVSFKNMGINYILTPDRNLTITSIKCSKYPSNGAGCFLLRMLQPKKKTRQVRPGLLLNGNLVISG
jgi:hypothetical protein